MSGLALDIARLAAPMAIAWSVGFLLPRTGFARRVSDVPNERSLHEAATPRVGGVGIVAATLPFMLLQGDEIFILAACAAFLAVVSLIDDMRSLPIEVRLPAHALAATVAVLAVPIDHAYAPVVAVLAVIAIVWATNLFNFMDGADGLAGGMALIGFGALALASWETLPPLAWTAAIIASAALGFLLLNFPPARIFMGDAGSIPLGFLAATLGWLGIAHGTWPAWFPLLVFSPFVADATVTLIRRALRGDAVWRAHRSHYYQRLVLHGWTKTRLAVSAYSLMLAVAASACLALRQGGYSAYAIIGAWTVSYAAIFIAIDLHAPSTGAPRGRAAHGIRKK